MVTFKTGIAMLKQARQRISDTLKHELGGKNKPKNDSSKQECWLRDALDLIANSLTTVDFFLCSGKATGPCTTFANKQDCTKGRSKFGINSSFHCWSLLLPPQSERPTSNSAQKESTMQKNQKPVEESYVHILLSHHQSMTLFSQPLWPSVSVCKMEITLKKRVRVTTDHEPTQWTPEEGASLLAFSIFMSAVPPIWQVLPTWGISVLVLCTEAIFA